MYAYIGTRTTPDRGTGRGIERFEILADGSWIPAGGVSAENPGYLVVDEEHHRIHAAHGDGSTVTTYDVDAHGTFSTVAVRATGGRNPAHAAFDASGRHLIVANHSSGSIASLRVGSARGDVDDRAPGPRTTVENVLALAGDPGPHRTDQTGPKPHQVARPPEKAWFLVPDKGLDAIFVCTDDEATGELSILGEVRLRESTGPRHIAFNPRLPMAYGVNELDSSVVVLDCTGVPTQPPVPVQYRGTLPPAEVRDSRAAEILVSPSGSHVLASNRSGRGDSSPGGPDHDTIAVYPVEDDGLLGRPAWLDSGGIRPRFMTWSPAGANGPESDGCETLVVANERTGNIVSMTLDPSGSVQKESIVAEVASPTCVVFASF